MRASSLGSQEDDREPRFGEPGPPVSSDQDAVAPRSQARGTRTRRWISFFLRWLTWMLPVGLLASWLVSYKCSQEVYIALGHDTLEMSCWRGRILLQVSHDPEAALEWAARFSSCHVLAPMDYAENCDWHWAGFGWYYATDSSNYVLPKPRVVSFWRIVVPCWFVLIAALTIPAWSVARWDRRRRRRLAGRCHKCGYDLTGNVSGVCPECGERIEEQA
jgi:hypothetical protein